MDDPLSARWHAREQARLRLAQLRLEDEGSIDRAVARACRIAQRAMRVDRVSLWTIEDACGLRCIHVADREPRIDATTNAILDLGAYERAMRDRRVVATADVVRDPVTSGMVETYFAPLGIASTLDAPLYREGRLAGMLCLEHRAERAWTDDEADFAISAADMIAALFASDELREAHEALRDHELALRETMTSEALGRVARGVAHDVNNVLAIVFTAVAVLERANGDPERVADATLAIRDAAQGATRLVQHLLAFGRPSSASTTSEVDAVIGGAEPVLRKLVGEDRRLSIALGASGWRVRLDAHQLEQIVYNLLVNAREATRENGTIDVRTRVVTSDDGARVVIDVADDGEGMDALTRARILEPFFTTKTGRANTGLGLAIVEGVVRSAAGRIEIESAPGEGTRFVISLPAVPTT